MRLYRRLLQKVAKTKTKLLCALRDAGCREAADLLQTPARDASVARCRDCQGCETLHGLGPCGSCPGCVDQSGCTEHSRLCFKWKQPATTFVAGSVVTGVSSACYLPDYDMTNYREMVDKLGDMSLDIESTLDEFPAGADPRQNERFSSERRERDVANEEEQLTVLSTLVLRYQEQNARLQEIDSDDDGPVDDAVDVSTLDPATYGIFSHTNTHYTFGDGPGPGAGVQLDHQQDDDRVLERVDDPPEGLDIPMEGLGLGEGLDFNLIDSESILAGGARASQSEAEGPQPHEELGARPKDPRRVTLPPTTTAAQPTLTGTTPREPPKTSGAAVPVVQGEDAVSPPRVVPKTSEIVVSMATGSPIRCVTTSGSATITTSSTKTTPSASASISSSAFTIHGRGRDRLRSASEGDPLSNPLGPITATRDELSRLKMLVSARTQSLSQDLMAVLDRLRGSSDVRTGWADGELRHLLDQMEKLEELESTIWMKMALVEGSASQKKRVDRWKSWKERQRARIRLIKEKSWDLQQTRPSLADATAPRKGTGHVEKVKLPTFSGRQEDFAEFRCQFRELCAGEGYTAILELAQLKLKLPRDALATIAGLQCPELAWKRLEEMYGNRELSILSALKNLREFKSSKSAAHEQVIDLAMAVQKCQTELKNIDAANELLGDRESIACIVQALPASVRDKWYDRKAPEDTQKRGEFLLEWMEEQRQTAIRVRLDVLAAKLRAPPGAPGKGAAPTETTDKGLLSSALHAQGTSKVGDVSVAADPSPRTKPKSGEEGGSARIEVKTNKDAQDVADKRKLSLEARKIDKCPVCGQAHTYQRTWAKLQPPVTAKLLSTHLTSCPKFMALSADAKLAAVLGNAACIVCAAWDHAVHKFPGGKLAKDPRCAVKVDGNTCGGQHGKWFHEGTESGASHSVVAATPSHGPGLYEVYSVPFVSSPGQGDDVSSKKGMIMVDPGSDTNFVRDEFARSLGVSGEPCEFRLKVVDLEARPIKTTRYVLELEDKTGARHSITAMGLDTITILPPDPDLSPISGLVRGYPSEVLQRPQGDVDLLLGLRDSYLHGCTVQQWGNLRLLESPLGCGWALRGTHPDLAPPARSLPASMSAAAYAIQKAERGPHPEYQLYHIQGRHEFQELDELGAAPPPVCLKCRGCRDCTFRRRRLSPEEQAVVTRVEQEMKVDTISGTITAKYPWKPCVRRMVDNRRQAVRVQSTMEEHMHKVGTHGGYVQEMLKSIKEGKVRRLTDNEMSNWHGPVHYITTFAVLKPESVSTKTRVVSNSAMRNARSKLSLNACMWPGPNALCDLYDCLIFWRSVRSGTRHGPSEGLPGNPHRPHGTTPKAVRVPGGARRGLGGLRIHPRHLRGRGGRVDPGNCQEACG